MKSNRKKLYDYTSLFMFFGIWTPMLWLINNQMNRYEMSSFSFERLSWLDIILSFVTVSATLVAQYGFICISDDLSDYERMKSDKKDESNFIIKSFMD